MTDPDFRQLVMDMRLAIAAARRAREGKPEYEHFDNLRRWREAVQPYFEEARRLTAAVDRELGLMPSEV